MRLFRQRTESPKLTDEERAALKYWLIRIGQRMPADGAFLPRIIDEAGPIPSVTRDSAVNKDIAFLAARYYAADLAGRYARQAWRACTEAHRAGQPVNVSAYRLRARYWEAVGRELAP